MKLKYIWFLIFISIHGYGQDINQPEEIMCKYVDTYTSTVSLEDLSITNSKIEKHDGGIFYLNRTAGTADSWSLDLTKPGVSFPLECATGDAVMRRLNCRSSNSDIMNIDLQSGFGTLIVVGWAKDRAISKISSVTCQI
jgi:hypothetical protein